jgi:hypothetical protein
MRCACKHCAGWCGNSPAAYATVATGVDGVANLVGVGGSGVVVVGVVVFNI